MSGVSNGIFTPKAMVGAALMGLIGAAGMFLIEQIYNDKRRVVLAHDLARLDKQVASMKEELDHLKELQTQFMQKKKNAQGAKRPPKHSRKTSATPDAVESKVVPASYASDTDHNTEYNSAVGTDYDVSSEEFYDMSETESEKEDGNRRDSATKNGTKISKEIEILSAVDVLLANGGDEDVNKAFEILKDLQLDLIGRQKPDSGLLCEILWRIGKCCQRKSNVCEKNNDAAGKKEVVFEGIEYCREAVERDPDNSEAHKWYAVLVGLRSDFVGTKERIQDGVLFNVHVQEALRLNPQDASLYHLIGRFKFELSILSWLERKVASTLFAEVPMANYDDALEEFKKAEELSSIQWKENRLLLAKCYIGKGDYSSAVEWLDKTVSVPSKTSDDEVAEIEAQSLLSKYSGYRRSK